MISVAQYNIACLFKKCSSSCIAFALVFVVELCKFMCSYIIHFLLPADAETLLIARIEELRYHIRVESAVQEGAEKAIKLLKNFKSVDKKPLQEVWNSYLLLMLMHCI